MQSVRYSRDAANYYDLDVCVAGGLDDAGFIDDLAKRTEG